MFFKSNQFIKDLFSLGLKCYPEAQGQVLVHRTSSVWSFRGNQSLRLGARERICGLF